MMTWPSVIAPKSEQPGQPERESAVELERSSPPLHLPPEQRVSAPAIKPTSVVGEAQA